MCLLGKIKINQLEYSVQFVAFPLRQQFLDRTQLREKKDRKRIGSDELVECFEAKHHQSQQILELC